MVRKVLLMINIVIRFLIIWLLWDRRLFKMNGKVNIFERSGQSFLRLGLLKDHIALFYDQGLFFAITITITFKQWFIFLARTFFINLAKALSKGIGVTVFLLINDPFQKDHPHLYLFRLDFINHTFLSKSLYINKKSKYSKNQKHFQKAQDQGTLI